MMTELTEMAMDFPSRKPHVDASVQALWYSDTTDALTRNAKTGATALHLAAYFGLIQLVTNLLGSTPDVDAQDSLGNTAIMYAAVEGHHEIVVQLLEAGASVNIAGHSGSNILHRAALQGRPDIVSILLRRADLDVNVADPSQRFRNALMLAALYGNVRVVELLLERDDLLPNLRAGKTALMYAAIQDHLEIVKLLLKDRRVSINDRDDFGATALMLAACNGCESIVEALLDAGADPEIKDGTKDGGGTPLLRAVDYDHLSVVRSFLKRNVNHTSKDRYDRTLLHGAAVNGRNAILQLLLEQTDDLDVNAQDKKGRVALHDRFVPLRR